MADVFELQSEVASSVAKTLELELLPAGKAQGSVAPAATSVAYEWYLKGRFHWNRRSKENLEKAIEFFERAILEDPVYARAYCGLADAYIVLPIWAPVSAQEVQAKAERYARQALDLEPNLAEAHASMAAVLSNKHGDYSGAEKELRRALELDPNYVTAVYWLGTSIQAQGRFDEALVCFERSRKLDPLSVIVYVNFATLYILWRKFDEAMQYCKQVLDLDPAWPRAYTDYALVHVFRGEFDRALAILEEARARGIWGLNEITVRGYTLGRMGRKEEARTALRDLEDRGKTSLVPPNFSAAVLAGLNESAEAVRAMAGALDSMTVSFPMLRWHPIWDPIRESPEFQALLAQAKAKLGA
jgi:serine/threonine-protein kinase